MAFQLVGSRKYEQNHVGFAKNRYKQTQGFDSFLSFVSFLHSSQFSNNSSFQLNKSKKKKFPTYLKIRRTKISGVAWVHCGRRSLAWAVRVQLRGRKPANRASSSGAVGLPCTDTRETRTAKPLPGQAQPWGRGRGGQSVWLPLFPAVAPSMATMSRSSLPVFGFSWPSLTEGAASSLPHGSAPSNAPNSPKYPENITTSSYVEICFEAEKLNVPSKITKISQPPSLSSTPLKSWQSWKMVYE